MEITLQPIGQIENIILNKLQSRIFSVFGCPVKVNNPIPVPGEAYIQLRDQYLSDTFLEVLKQYKQKQYKVLGITEVELFTNGLNFLFGQADSKHSVAVVSLHLLRQEQYGLAPDETLFIDRAVKEAIHELGHTFGIGHCSDTSCVMHFSNSLSDTDYKETYFCSHCRPKLIL